MKKIISRPILIALVILLIPFFGNMYIDGWNWTTSDFVIWGCIVFGAALIYQLIARKGGTSTYRLAAGVATVTGFLLVWSDLAVGNIGEDNPANLFFLFIPLIALIGGTLVGFKPHGMVRVISLVAIIQILIPVIALIFWPSDFSPGAVRVFGINAIFALLWVESALLFHRAGNTHLQSSTQLA